MGWCKARVGAPPSGCTRRGGARGGGAWAQNNIPSGLLQDHQHLLQSLLQLPVLLHKALPRGQAALCPP